MYNTHSDISRLFGSGRLFCVIRFVLSSDTETCSSAMTFYKILLSRSGVPLFNWPITLEYYRQGYNPLPKTLAVLTNSAPSYSSGCLHRLFVTWALFQSFSFPKPKAVSWTVISYTVLFVVLDHGLKTRPHTPRYNWTWSYIARGSYKTYTKVHYIWVLYPKWYTGTWSYIARGSCT